MAPLNGHGAAPVLSVVIPSFNSATWLPSTLAALAEAVREAGRPTEIVVVDDGSTDDTPQVVAGAVASFPGDLRIVVQPNKGRFLARWEGLQQTSAELVLLLDSRVLVDRNALRHVFEQIAAQPSRVAWNASVTTDPGAPLVGLFWEVPTHVFWGSYLRSPDPMDLTIDNFDQAPKGTTMFLARRDVLVDAFQHAWPQAHARLVSDDTKVLRRIAERFAIRLDPNFSATYRPRTTVRGFVHHTFNRGTLFVDSYAGTTVLRSIVLLTFAVLPLALLTALTALFLAGLSPIAWALIVVAALLAVVPAFVAASNRCPGRSIVAFLVFLPVFVVPFWLGLVRGILVHRRSFRRSAAPHEGVAPGTELQ